MIDTWVLRATESMELGLTRSQKEGQHERLDASSGIGRESYKGEPKTRNWGGSALHFKQAAHPFQHQQAELRGWGARLGKWWVGGAHWVSQGGDGFGPRQNAAGHDQGDNTHQTMRTT